MFKGENIMASRIEKRYESQPDSIKRELDVLSDAFDDDYSVFKQYQLKVIKRKIRYNKFRKSKKQSKKGGHALKTLVE